MMTNTCSVFNRVIKHTVWLERIFQAAITKTHRKIPLHSLFLSVLLFLNASSAYPFGNNRPGPPGSTTINGTLYDDANGLTNSTVDGSGTQAAYVNLVNASTDLVVSSLLPGTDGSYTFSGVATGIAYKIILTSTSRTVNATLTVSSLPTGWVSTGEFLGSGAGNDGTIDGILSTGTVSASVTNANLGINQIPTANNVTGSSQQNPGGNYKVTVTTLTGSDAEDGSYSGISLANTIKIQTLPANGTLYYNGIAVTAGQTIINYNPALLTVDPDDGISSLTFTFSEIDAAGYVSTPANLTMPFTTPVPFPCSGLAYQIAGSPAQLNSYNINTGSTTILANIPYQVNNTGFSTIDDMIYGYDQINNTIVRMDANGNTTVYTVPNLPAGVYNAGDVITGGYLFIYIDGGTTYYIVDVNPTHANFMQLVDPTAGYTLDAAPYGTTVAGVRANDLAYNATTGLLYGLVNPGNTNRFKVVTINPVTAAVTYSSKAVTGAGIQSETSGFGSVFSDMNFTKLYVFANDLGKFYQIDLTTNTAVLMSNSVSTGYNDGASCPMAFLSAAIKGNVYDDANGLTDNTVNGTGTNVGNTLIAVLWDATTGQVADTAYVTAAGTYSFTAISGDDYSVYLTTTIAATGQTSVPVITLPGGWTNTGEYLGSGAGSDGSVDAKLSLGTLSGDIDYADFGIEQLPKQDNKLFSNFNSSNFTDTQSNSNPSVPGYQGIPANSSAFSSYYSTLGDMTGSDSEDCPASSSCDIGKSFYITSVNSNTLLYYNETAITGGMTITNINPALLTIYKQNGQSDAGFSYQLIDAAGLKNTTPATWLLTTYSLLAFELKSFNAIVQQQNIHLRWSVSSGTNMSYFGIWHSNDGNHWSAIGKVIADSYEGNNEYDFTDADPATGVNFYKLKIYSDDGSSGESNVISAKIKISGTPIFAFPNPATTELQIRNIADISFMKVYDVRGDLVLSKSTNNIATTTLNISGLGAGAYYIVFFNTNGTIVQRLKFLKMIK